MKKFLIDLLSNVAADLVADLLSRLMEWLLAFPWHSFFG
jgi:hypothetical protein